MKLNQIAPAKGATRKRKRVGRGPGSGLGKTAGRGNKGQKSRRGYSRKRGHEGGQMPLMRRMPKRGFTNPFRKEYAVVNLDVLNRFPKGGTVTPELLLSERVVRSLRDGIAVLGRGELKHALTVKAHRFSGSAKAKIEAAGGTAEVVAG
jgi:large subunit ribosomal protein L15